MIAFVLAYETLGYEACADGKYEKGFEKIVIYSRNGQPTHAARLQSDSGLWTSKLGGEIDVEHDSPEALIREIPVLLRQYGDPIQFMKRPVVF